MPSLWPDKQRQKEFSVGILIDGRRYKHPASLSHRRSHPGVVLTRIMQSLDGVEAQDYPANRVQKPVVLLDEGMAMMPKDREGLKERARILDVPTPLNRAVGLNQGIVEVNELRPDLAFILDAGSHYATNQAFRAGAQVKQRGALAAFGSRLADWHASRVQSLGRMARAIPYLDTQPRPAYVHRPSLIPADGMVYDARRLPEYPFDKIYARGGANNNLLRLAADEGEVILYHPVLSLQSGERNLGPFALAQLAAEAIRVQDPTSYDS